MQHKGRLAIAIALLLALATPVQAATPKAGAKCTKAGATATAGYPWDGGAVSDCGDAASTSL